MVRVNEALSSKTNIPVKPAKMFLFSGKYSTFPLSNHLSMLEDW